MSFRHKVREKERLAYLMYAARLWSEITIVFGFLIILYLILKQIF